VGRASTFGAHSRVSSNGPKSYLQTEIKNIPEALAAIDRAVDTLYQHGDFRHVSHQLFRATVEGAITIEQEDLIQQLGIRT
jgi:hypothetical protein